MHAIAVRFIGGLKVSLTVLPPATAQFAADLACFGPTTLRMPQFLFRVRQQPTHGAINRSGSIFVRSAGALHIGAQCRSTQKAVAALRSTCAWPNPKLLQQLPLIVLTVLSVLKICRVMVDAWLITGHRVAQRHAVALKAKDAVGFTHPYPSFFFASAAAFIRATS